MTSIVFCDGSHVIRTKRLQTSWWWGGAVWWAEVDGAPGAWGTGPSEQAAIDAAVDVFREWVVTP